LVSGGVNYIPDSGTTKVTISQTQTQGSVSSNTIIVSVTGGGSFENTSTPPKTIKTGAIVTSISINQGNYPIVASDATNKFRNIASIKSYVPGISSISKDRVVACCTKKPTKWNDYDLPQNLSGNSDFFAYNSTEMYDNFKSNVGNNAFITQSDGITSITPTKDNITLYSGVSATLLPTPTPLPKNVQNYTDITNMAKTYYVQVFEQTRDIYYSPLYLTQNVTRTPKTFEQYGDFVFYYDPSTPLKGSITKPSPPITPFDTVYYSMISYGNLPQYPYYLFSGDTREGTNFSTTSSCIYFDTSPETSDFGKTNFSSLLGKYLIAKFQPDDVQNPYFLLTLQNSPCNFGNTTDWCSDCGAQSNSDIASQAISFLPVINDTTQGEPDIGQMNKPLCTNYPDFIEPGVSTFDFANGLLLYLVPLPQEYQPSSDSVLHCRIMTYFGSQFMGWLKFNRSIEINKDHEILPLESTSSNTPPVMSTCPAFVSYTNFDILDTEKETTVLIGDQFIQPKLKGDVTESKVYYTENFEDEDIFKITYNSDSDGKYDIQKLDEGDVFFSVEDIITKLTDTNPSAYKTGPNADFILAGSYYDTTNLGLHPLVDNKSYLINVDANLNKNGVYLYSSTDETLTRHEDFNTYQKMRKNKVVRVNSSKHTYYFEPLINVTITPPSGSAGTGATVDITSIDNGVITGITLVNGGTGYTTTTEATITEESGSQGSGSGATVGITVVSGIITRITLLNGGSGYFVNNGIDLGTQDITYTRSPTDVFRPILIDVEYYTSIPINIPTTDYIVNDTSNIVNNGYFSENTTTRTTPSDPRQVFISTNAQYKNMYWSWNIGSDEETFIFKDVTKLYNEVSALTNRTNELTITPLAGVEKFMKEKTFAKGLPLTNLDLIPALDPSNLSSTDQITAFSEIRENRKPLELMINKNNDCSLFFSFNPFTDTTILRAYNLVETIGSANASGTISITPPTVTITPPATGFTNPSVNVSSGNNTTKGTLDTGGSTVTDLVSTIGFKNNDFVAITSIASPTTTASGTISITPPTVAITPTATGFTNNSPVTVSNGSITTKGTIDKLSVTDLVSTIGFKNNDSISISQNTPLLQNIEGVANQLFDPATYDSKNTDPIIPELLFGFKYRFNQYQENMNGSTVFTVIKGNSSLLVSYFVNNEQQGGTQAISLSTGVSSSPPSSYPGSDSGLLPYIIVEPRANASEPFARNQDVIVASSTTSTPTTITSVGPNNTFTITATQPTIAFGPNQVVTVASSTTSTSARITTVGPNNTFTITATQPVPLLHFTMSYNGTLLETFTLP